MRCENRNPHPPHDPCIGVTEEQAALYAQAMATIGGLLGQAAPPRHDLERFAGDLGKELDKIKFYDLADRDAVDDAIDRVLATWR